MNVSPSSSFSRERIGSYPWARRAHVVFRKAAWLTIAMFVVLLLGASGRADELIKSNGDVIKGDVLRFEPKLGYQVKLANTSLVWISSAEVDHIDFHVSSTVEEVTKHRWERFLKSPTGEIVKALLLLLIGALLTRFLVFKDTSRRVDKLRMLLRSELVGNYRSFLQSLGPSVVYQLIPYLPFATENRVAVIQAVFAAFQDNARTALEARIHKLEEQREHILDRNELARCRAALLALPKRV